MYQALEVVVPRRARFSSLKKVVADRLLFAPPYLLALFYFVAIMEVSLAYHSLYNKFCLL